MGRAKGKVGSVVFSVLKGQQITRAHNANNASRTHAQVSQRVSLAACVYFYKFCILNFFKFAFNDKKATESDYNAFVRSNIASTPVYLTKEQAAQYFPVIAPYQMSQGKLPNAGYIDDVDENYIDYCFDIPAITATTTWGNVCKSIADKYNLEEGDMLTVVGIGVEDLSAADGVITWGGKPASMVICQFILDFSDTTLATAKTGIPGLKPIEVGAVKITIEALINIDSTASNSMAGCCITSRKVNGVVKVSTSKLQLNSEADSVYDILSSDAQHEAAARSYGFSEAILDPTSLD